MGTTVATLAAGALAVWADWRAAFAKTAVGTAVFLVLLRGVLLPAGDGARRDVRSAFTAWPLWTSCLGFLEGAILLDGTREWPRRGPLLVGTVRP
ncbi:Putative iron-regulated membrane protein FtpC in pyochelin gene cluster [Actinacidiphila cocklensis]|uniref:Iron-regulated membrane protein FtpC in pyochelin gene cluster n=1 Tax=Actinacidiphila cocklensis TaxID=887465 RepID=A0A9W4GTM3_9ACTN|nr:Putative iron-regulated membrane protein FtpC in pyochelin gene cluster [Actinacidiphila cocklensis]